MWLEQLQWQFISNVWGSCFYFLSFSSRNKFCPAKTTSCIPYYKQMWTKLVILSVLFFLPPCVWVSEGGTSLDDNALCGAISSSTVSSFHVLGRHSQGNSWNKKLSAVDAQHRAKLLPLLAAASFLWQFPGAEAFLVISYITYADWGSDVIQLTL